MRRSFMRIRHKATGKTALGIRVASGCVLVQFDDIEHRHSHGWHLYPRHHWVRSGKQRIPRIRQFSNNPYMLTIGRHSMSQQELHNGGPAAQVVAETLREQFRETYPRDLTWRERHNWPADEPLPPFVVGNQAGWYP